MLREAVSSGSDLGRAVEEIMRRGELVPDELVLGLISGALGSAKCSNGALFDGFPRTLR